MRRSMWRARPRSSEVARERSGLLASVRYDSRVGTTNVRAVTRLVTAVASFVAVALASTRSGRCADEAEHVPSFGLTGMVGRGTHVGTGGGLVEFSPARFIILDAGVGTTQHGLRGGAGGRVMPSAATTLSLGLHLSAGPYSMSTLHDCLLGCAGSYDGYRRWKVAFWSHVDVSIDAFLSDAVLLRPSIGIAWINNPGSSVCEPGTPACRSEASPILTFGLALGFRVRLRAGTQGAP